jgi:hypothetical protein
MGLDMSDKLAVKEKTPEETAFNGNTIISARRIAAKRFGNSSAAKSHTHLIPLTFP